MTESVRRWSGRDARPCAELPRKIVLEPTYRCNLRCRMCWWWGENGVAAQRETPDTELPLAAWKAWIDCIRELGPEFRITGGEPLLRPDLVELVEFIAGSGMACSLITNGTLLDEAAAGRLVAAGLWQMNVSVDGDAEADALVRGPGAFSRSLAAIDAVLAARRRQNTAAPDILVNCVITARNIDQIAVLAGLCRDRAVSLRLQHLMWIDEETYHRHREELRSRFGLEDPTMRGFLPAEEPPYVERLIEVLSRLDCLGPGASRALYTLPRLSAEGIRRWYGRVPAEAGGCSYASRCARVNADGDVIGCPFVDFSFGNIRKGAFADILTSPRARLFREELAARLLPGCARCCKRPVRDGVAR